MPTSIEKPRIPESKNKDSKTNGGGVSKGHRSQLEVAPTDQTTGQF